MILMPDRSEGFIPKGKSKIASSFASALSNLWGENMALLFGQLPCSVPL